MNNVNQTLYIPLYGKAYVSKKGVILHDPKAEEIWAAEGFVLKGKSKSKWLAYYMGMRSKVFDQWVSAQMNQFEDAQILHLGCGMDSRVERVGTNGHTWYDVDFPDVIQERKRYYEETHEYHMIGTDVRDSYWLENLPKTKSTILVMEGVSMYLSLEELKQLLETLGTHFSKVLLLMDCYTVFAAKASKYKNPINEVGVTVVHGIDDPKVVEAGTGFVCEKEHDMTPQMLIGELQGAEKFIFQKVFGGNISKKMYRLYEYRRF